jgi:hypothetical protein
VIVALRKRLTYANIAMTLALVFAMSGGAYAAKHYLITSTKQISPKVLKQLRGKAGPAGKGGAQGPQGPQGPQGSVGATGEKGANGANGVSPEGVAFSGSAHGCAEGGVEFKGANTSYACNGAQGPAGPFVSKVPTEKTLTGFWSAAQTGGLKTSLVPVSFAFPVSPAPTLVIIRPNDEAGFLVKPSGFEGFLSEEEIKTFCPGSAAAPSAEPGYLCVYTEKQKEMEVGFPPSMLIEGFANPTEYGAAVPVIVGATAEEGEVRGTWAVTAK